MKVCLFDLGNVLIFFSHERMHRQVGDVTGLDPTALRSLFERDQLALHYECGTVSDSELLAAVRTHAKKPFSDDAFFQAMSDIFQPNLSMIPILASLRRQGIRLVIVSNTNAAHMAFAQPRFECFRFFDAKIFSHEIHAMKPDPKFYEAALVAAEHPREQCLFIDDLAANIEGARRFGFQGILFTDAATFQSQLAAFEITLS